MKLDVIEAFLPYQGDKYLSPQKAGSLAVEMETVKLTAQKARQAFTEIAERFCQQIPGFDKDKTSQWMNQAQYLRPHFWVYFVEEGRSLSRPAIALRILNHSKKLGFSLEVSIVERQKDEKSLENLHRLLDLPVCERLYYFAQQDGVSCRFAMTEENRQYLKQELLRGHVRKVQLKCDVPDVVDYPDEAALMVALKEAWQLLLPYYEATKSNKNLL